MSKKAKRPEVKCPHCDNTDLGSIRFIEDVISSRRLGGYNKDGQFLIDGESDEDMEGAKNQRFECHRCWEEFPIPDGLPIEWDV